LLPVVVVVQTMVVEVVPGVYYQEQDTLFLGMLM
jgi:hypothetical protein